MLILPLVSNKDLVKDIPPISLMIPGVTIVWGKFLGCGEEIVVSRTDGAFHSSISGTVTGLTNTNGTTTSTHMQLGSPDCSPLHTIFINLAMWPSIASKCCQVRRPNGTPRSSNRDVSFGTGHAPSIDAIVAIECIRLPRLGTSTLALCAMSPLIGPIVGCALAQVSGIQGGSMRARFPRCSLWSASKLGLRRWSPRREMCIGR